MVSQAVTRQHELDKDVIALLEKMNGIYKFILSAETLKMVEAHRETAQRMCQQTTECSIFIREYTSHGFGKPFYSLSHTSLTHLNTLAKRTIMAPIKGYKNQITAYAGAFDNLRQSFLDESTLFKELTVFQISLKTDSILSELKEICKHRGYDVVSLLILFIIAAKDDLKVLPYARLQREHQACDTGTRLGAIAEIMDWFSQDLEHSANRVFWLYGVAGCGKSTIAQSIVEQMTAQRRCVSFFFDASRQTEAGPDHLFSTISQDLADLNPGWRASLVNVIQTSTKARESSTVKAQFDNLMLLPAKEVDVIGPILIVIDALDECGSQDQRATLLRVLSRLEELPISFRFLITSRPEKDIRTVFNKIPWIRAGNLDWSDESMTNSDIRQFVRNRLVEVPELEGKPIEELAHQISYRSDGLFQWASTACKYISGDDKVGCDPIERLDEVLTSDSYGGLDGLYGSILNHVCAFESGDKTERLYQTIMGRVLSLREPLSLAALSELWFEEKDKEQAKNILSPLGSLLRGVSDLNEPIQPLHASFPDFLRDKTRSKQYWVDTDRQAEMLSAACLRKMQELLRFNICKLETSYVFNRDIVDLGSRVKQSIPPHLSYACCFRVNHFHNIIPTTEWCGRVNAFMKHYFLSWLETLSLMNRVERAHAQLSMSHQL
jgi:hypothetical protein